MTDTRRFGANAIALALLQMANYIAPLMVLPYLTRVIGSTNLGLVLFGLSAVLLAGVITDFGFNMSATASLAQHPSMRLRIASSVLTCKFGLVAAIALAMAAFASFWPQYSSHKFFYWTLLVPIIGQAFQPTWYFQGAERMQHITVYTVVAKLLYIGLVFAFVHTEQHYARVIVCYGVANIAAAVLGMALMFLDGFRFRLPRNHYLIDTMRVSSSFFWARVSSSVYTAGGAFILGITAAPIEVAKYGVAEQLYKGLQALIFPISQALYPTMARTRNESLFWRIFRWTMLGASACAVLGVVMSDWVLNLLFGPELGTATDALHVFLGVFILSTASIMLGYPFLAAMGRANVANRSVVVGGMIFLSCVLFCVSFGLASATVLTGCLLITEVCVLAMRVWSASRLHAEGKSE